MEEPLLTKSEGKNVLMKSPASKPIGPPPSKKLKQARLPFAPKQANSPPASIASKKRKLSDGAKTDKQPAKQAKSEENAAEKDVIVVEDNEVSSSSEAEHAKPKHGKQEKPKKTIKDMFAGFAQQSEVSTSSASPEPSKIKGDDENEDEKIESPSDDPGKVADDHETENKDSEKVSSELEKDDSKESTGDKQKPSDESKENTAENEEDSPSTNEDKENISVLSVTGVDTSLMETSDVGDEDSGTEADTSVNEGTDAGSSTVDKGKDGSSTPAGVNRRRKSVMSEKKKAERGAMRQRKKEQMEKEKAEKLAEKQKQKEERLKQKQEEKEKKEQEKQALKEKKEKERQEKLEQKEKEKEEKNRLKEEEKKKKMDEIEAKMEEKKKKEEEKKKKEEEKKQAEEEESMKKQKVKQAFVSFFKKVEKPAVQTKPQQKSNGLFMEFEPKKDMRLAPVVRYTLPDSDKMSLDQEMENQACKKLYVDQLKAKELKPRTSGETWPWEEDDLEIVDEETAKPKRMKAKFLYFHANYRPPYYGTWRKQSSKIGPRRPLNQDAELFDYEVDSDDEWEEEEPGESLSNSEGEGEGDDGEENKDDDDEDDDGFFVPHGYLSEGEGCEDEDAEDCTPERIKARQLAKAKAFEAEMKQKCQALRAFFIGCLWWTPDGSTDPNYKKLTEFTAVSLCAGGAIEVGSSINKSSGAQETSPSTSNKMKTPKETGETRGPVRKSVPEEAMPELIRLVHGNRASIQKLIKEFREFWAKKTLGQDQVSSTSLADISYDNCEAMDTSLNNPSEGNTSICTPGTSEGKKCTISKRQLDITIRSIANYTKKEGFHFKCWYVSEDVIKKHGLTDLPVPTEWVWLTRSNIKRPEEEPSTPNTPSGRDTPTQASTPAPNSITKFTVPKSQLPSPQVDPSTPKSRDCAPSSSQSTTPKVAQEKLTPRNLMSIKSAFAAIPKTKPGSAGTNSEAGKLVKQDEKNDCTIVDDDDCMIVDDSSLVKDSKNEVKPAPHKSS